MTLIKTILKRFQSVLIHFKTGGAVIFKFSGSSDLLAASPGIIYQDD